MAQACVPVTGSVTNITTNSATCGGNMTSFGSPGHIDERGIVYGLSANPDIFGNRVIEGQTTLGSYTCILTGLTSNTTYHYRAYGTIPGLSGYGSDLTFTTLSNTSKNFTLSGGNRLTSGGKYIIF